MDNDASSHHGPDKLFKSTFQEKSTLVDLIREFFPVEIMENIDFDALTIDNTHYISSKMVETFADVVYRTSWKGAGRPVAIALLLEHKSTPERYFYVQLLSYIVSIWQEDIQAKRPLSIIIPVVFYSGNKTWNPKSILTYFKHLPIELERFIPVFEFMFISVDETPDEMILRLSDDSTLKALMLMFKKVGNLEFIQAFLPLFFKFEQNHPERKQLFDIFVAYFFNNAPLEPEQIRDLADKTLDENMRAKVMTSFEELLLEKQEKGKEIGKEIGKAEERALAEAKTRKAIESLLLDKIYSLKKIAKILDVPMDLVKKVRDGLLKSGDQFTNN